MEYKVLNQDDQDDIIVSFILAQERDHHCHTVNKERYERMVASLPAGKFSDRVRQLLAETNERLAEVSAIIAATQAQAPPEDRIDAARSRLEAKPQG